MGNLRGTRNVLGHVSETAPRIGAAAVTPHAPVAHPPGHRFGASLGLSGFPFRHMPCHTPRKALIPLPSQ
jgi:hypothetical protein